MTKANIVLLWFLLLPVSCYAFTPPNACRSILPLDRSLSKPCGGIVHASTGRQSLSLQASTQDEAVLGVTGISSAMIVLYSEYILKMTGCGLPAGPFGILGLLEGLSYLGVVGISGYSLIKKLRTGSGLPAGPGGLLGTAEGLSYLAIVMGLVVLGFQIVDYGYIPNAVPKEGGMCS